MLVEQLSELISSMRRFGSDLTEVEAKAARDQLPKSAKESLSAFANRGGGTLVLGVSEDESFAVTGVEKPSKMSSDLASMCANELEPPLRPVISALEFEGAWVVVAEVAEAEASQKPCYVRAKGMSRGSYLRVHDGDHLMSSFEVQMLLANHGQPLSDVEPIPGTSVETLDGGLVSAFVARVKQVRAYAYEGLDRLGVLRLANVLVQDVDGVERVSVGGLLALGQYPQRTFPQLAVTLVVYPSESGPEDASGVRFLDNVTLEGPIPVMARDALSAVRRNMRRRSSVDGIGRTDTWEYPEAALREAIVNALVHRDLSPASRGTQVQIEMYPDRLLVRNPGGLFGPVSVSDLGQSGSSSARNSFLLKILEDVSLPGEDRTVCENRGSGIRAMVNALRDAGMSLPRFDDKVGSFLVTFPNHTLMDEETVAWLRDLEEPGLTDSQHVALAILRSGDKLDNARYRAATRVDSRRATTELQDLVSRELAVQLGTRRWTEYRLAIRPDLETPESAPRRRPRDRQPIILEALGSGPMSRNEIEGVTGLSKQVVIHWLRILRRKHLVRTVGEAPVQSKNVRYERTQESWGQATLEFDFSDK